MSRHLLILLFAVVAASAGQSRFPLDRFLLPPRSSASADWAPGGKRFLCEREGGIWLYDVPSAASRQLVSLKELEAKAVPPPESDAFDWQNRRVREQTYQWSSSGNEILILAGGDIFLHHLGSGATDQLTATPARERDPKLSPDGRMVSFRRGHDLYVLDIAGKKVTRLTSDGSATLLNAELDWVYPEELDLTTAHWWSPDSTRIAFLQFDVSREPVFPQVHMLQPKAVYEPELFPQPGTPNADVRLGVVAATGGPVKWMDLGDPRDRLLARVYWTPDSSAVAALRLPRVQNQLDLVLADARTGAARVVIREQDDAWINVRDDFRFLQSGDRFIWGSERDGFRHLYLYAIDGRRLGQITRGDWEVTQVAAVDENARQIFYVSTEASPRERQLYRIGFDGKHKQRLTNATGTHTITMSPAADYYLDVFSSVNAMPEATLNDRSGERVRVYAEAAKPPEWKLQTELLDFKTAAGERFHARLIKPPDFTPGHKYPVIVMIYGGPGSQQVRDAWTPAYLDQYLAHSGFVIWQIDNRGSSGRGHRWEAAIHLHMGETELADQLEGLRYLDSLGFADMTRVGMYGWSYGGYMTLYSLTHAPDTFRAGIAGAPVTDWRNYDTIYTERYMGLPESNAAGYQKSSPVTSAAGLKAKLMIVHNFEDDNVHFANSMQMAAALENAGKHFELRLYPQRTHGVVGGLRRHLWETIAQFFEANLK